MAESRKDEERRILKQLKREVPEDERKRIEAIYEFVKGQGLVIQRNYGPTFILNIARKLRDYEISQKKTLKASGGILPQAKMISRMIEFIAMIEREMAEQIRLANEAAAREEEAAEEAAEAARRVDAEAARRVTMTPEEHEAALIANSRSKYNLVMQNISPLRNKIFKIPQEARNRSRRRREMEARTRTLEASRAIVAAREAQEAEQQIALCLLCLHDVELQLRESR